MPGLVSCRRRTVPIDGRIIYLLLESIFFPYFLGARFGAGDRDELPVGEKFLPNIDGASANSWRSRLSRLISRLPV